jgi:hypothetical protein
MSGLHFCSVCKAEHTVSPEIECSCSCGVTLKSVNDEQLKRLSDRFWQQLSGSKIPENANQFFKQVFKPITEIYESNKHDSTKN